MDSTRDAAATLVALVGTPGVVLQKAKVTAVNAGPPASLNLLIENQWTVEGVRYLASYATPAVNDAVYVLGYGPGRRLVIGEEA